MNRVTGEWELSAGDGQCAVVVETPDTHTHTQKLCQTTLCNEIFITVWVSTNRQFILVWIEEVFQVVDGHRQVGLVDQAGGSHAVVSRRPLSFCINKQTLC